MMLKPNATRWRLFKPTKALGGALLFLILNGPLLAQQSPWGNVAKKLADEFTGPIARALALVAIVVGGLTIAFTDGGGTHRIIGNLVFGLGLALGAVQFMAWLFG
jgi:type IV secretion system protein TrbC